MCPDREEARRGDLPRTALGWSGEGGRVKPALTRLAPLALISVLVGCGDDGTTPSSLRFGQVGEIRAQVRAPVAPLGKGELQQILTWNSNGAWQLRESVSYRGLTGDERLLRNEGNPAAFASAYASLVTQLNETPGLDLFIETLPPELQPECELPRSSVTFRIRDDARDDEVSWERCAMGTLTTLNPSGAGPDPDAARVIVATELARDFTLGSEFLSAFQGTIPFGTLDRGESSQAALEAPRAFRTEAGSGEPPSDWLDFWQAHSGGSGSPPEVDWAQEMVMVAVVGERFEAGDSVEVRRIVTVGEDLSMSTVVEYLERIPGDFCSPAARTQRPFHIVVAPRTSGTIRFSKLATERVACGF